MLLVQPLNRRLFVLRTYGREQLAHCVEIAQCFAGAQLAAEVRDLVSGIQRMGDEASRLAYRLIIAEEVIPVVEQCLQKPVNIQLGLPIPAASTARTVPPPLAMPVTHVLRDVGAQPHTNRLETPVDSFSRLGRRGFLTLSAHASFQSFPGPNLRPLSPAP